MVLIMLFMILLVNKVFTLIMIFSEYFIFETYIKIKIPPVFNIANIIQFSEYVDDT